jgi:hypothetical protein
MKGVTRVAAIATSCKGGDKLMNSSEALLKVQPTLFRRCQAYDDFGWLQLHLVRMWPLHLGLTVILPASDAYSIQDVTAS